MKIKPIAWIAMALTIAGIFLFGVSIDLIALGIFIDALLIFTLFYKTICEKKEKFCSKCKEQFDFEEDVAYTEISRQLKTYRTNPNSDKRQVDERLYYNIRFDCTCGNCGEKKVYKKKMYGGCSYDDGSGELLDVEDVIEQWYQRPGLSVNHKKTIFAFMAVGVISIMLSIVMFILPPLSGGGQGRFKGDKTLDAYDYYGTYYAVSENYMEYKLDVFDRRVQFTQRPLNESAIIGTYDNAKQVFYTAEYVKYSGKEPDFDFYGALVLEESNNSFLWFYIVDNTEDDAKFRIQLQNGSYVELTRTEKTVETVTQDPKDYYGTYKYNSENSLKLYSNSCSLVFNGEPSKCTYLYADEAMLRYFEIYEGKSGIIVFQADGSYGWFIFKGDDLYYQNTNCFEKQ